MLPRRTLAVACAAVAVTAGSAAAIAATGTDDAKKAETEVLTDAARQLGVQSDELRRALATALDAQLDKAVKEGRLTQEQADAIKKRRAQSGTVLPLGPRFGGPGHRRLGGPGARGAMLSAAAKVLGITPAQLHERLHEGKTIAQIAKDQNKDLADVKSAMKNAAVATLDAAVKAGRLTDTQRDEIIENLDARVDSKVQRRLADRRGFGRRGYGPRGHGRGFGPPPGGAAPDSGAGGTENGSLPPRAPSADLAPA